MFRSAQGQKEYEDIRRGVESYEDGQGNWVRPEGSRAEKSRNSSTPKALDWIPGVGAKKVDKEKARKLYREASEQFEKAKLAEGRERIAGFRKAAATYKNASKNWVSSALEQDALMMMGESYFFAEEYPDAERAYAKLLKEYPRNRYQDTVEARHMEIALYWMQVDRAEPRQFYNVNFTDVKLPWNDTGGHAKRVLNSMRLNNPTGNLMDDATMELANAAFLREDFEAAADTYSELRTIYPDSPHLFKAHFLGLKAVMETYQGALYSVEPLEEAEKLIKQMTKQFPKESKEEQEFLNRAFAEIRYNKSERHWLKADYYLKRGEYSSAKHYIELIEKDFSDTPFAEKAHEGLAIVTEHPKDQERYLQWLKIAFPEKNNKVNRLIRESENSTAEK